MGTRCVQAETKQYDLDFKNPDSAPEMKKTAKELIEYYKSWLFRAQSKPSLGAGLLGKL